MSQAWREASDLSDRSILGGTFEDRQHEYTMHLSARSDSLGFEGTRGLLYGGGSRVSSAEKPQSGRAGGAFSRWAAEYAGRGYAQDYPYATIIHKMLRYATCAMPDMLRRCTSGQP